MALAQSFCGFPDFTLAWQKNQHIALPDLRQLVDRVRHCVDQIALLSLFLCLTRRIFRRLHGAERTVAHLNRIQPAGNLDHRGRLVANREMSGKTLRIDGRRCDDQLQIRPAREQLLQIAKQEIDVQAALVRLVDDDRVVLLQERISLRFSQQDAVSHQFDRGALAYRIIEANLEADMFSRLGTQLMRNALGSRGGGDAARLRVADQACLPPPQLKTNLWQLRRLAGTGFAANDDDLMATDGLGNVVAPRRHRQRFREGNRRQLVAEGGHEWALLPAPGRVRCFFGIFGR